MAKLQKEVAWLSDADFSGANPRPATLTSVEFVDGAFKKTDLIARFTFDPNVERQMSVWGANKNALIAAFGDETDGWVGKRIRISQTIDAVSGKKMRSVSAL